MWVSFVWMDVCVVEIEAGNLEVVAVKRYRCFILVFFLSLLTGLPGDLDLLVL